MAIVVRGPKDWRYSETGKGHRNYEVDYLAKATTSDGPYDISHAGGIPAVGSTWSFGSDVDAWAYRLPGVRLKKSAEHGPEAGIFYEVTIPYSTELPGGGDERCNTNEIEDPLLEPARISGSFVKFTKEA